VKLGKQSSGCCAKCSKKRTPKKREREITRTKNVESQAKTVTAVLSAVLFMIRWKTLPISFRGREKLLKHNNEGRKIKEGSTERGRVCWCNSCHDERAF
jgi:hypothetical protein